MTALPNPESTWERPEECLSVEPVEIERRLGPTDEAAEILSGGLANVNVRVGARVLRIYRRDGGAVGKEKTLLQLPWESFAVPPVMGFGDDFIVLQYVPHGALDDTAEHGTQFGRALAEIHRHTFAEAGFLDADLQVCTPFHDVVESLSSHAHSELERAALPPDSTLRLRLAAFLRAHLDALRHRAHSTVLLHGDFKASNLHWTSGGRLLVLDWEFAYAGPALLDVGQLIRWHPSAAFVLAFGESYRQHGGELPDEWERWAEIYDLFNLAGLLSRANPQSRRSVDVQRRIEQTLGSVDR